MAGQKRAYENWKKMKFRLLIVSKFSSFSALRRKLDEGENSEEEDVTHGPEPVKWFIIDHNSRNKLFWNMFTNIFYMISFFTFPLVIAFNFETMTEPRVLYFEFCLDLIMLCDIITEFITTKEKEDKTLDTMKTIASAYIQSTFVFDIAACLPGLLTFESDPKWFMFKVFRYL